MKKMLSLALSALVVAGMALTASAAGTDILKGTPVLDGALDDIYLQSASFVIENPTTNYPWGGYADELYSDATAYFLWDDDYVYICTVMADDTPVSAVAAKGAEGPDAGWQNDAAEHWFIDEDLRHKIHVAGDGNFFLGADGDGTTAYDFDAAKSAAVQTKDGWVTEIALPMNDLEAGKTFGYSLQINNCTVEDISVGYAVGDQSGAVVELVCSADEVDLPEPETEAETVADAAGEATTEAAPQTFDAGIVAAVAAIVSAAGYAISKKR